jgi:hypothetical protein
MADGGNSRTAFEHYRDASQRFEYFILGISLALVAYAGQTLAPQRLGLNAYTLEVIGILVIISAIVISFKRLEKIISGLQMNFHLVDSREGRGLLAKAFIEGGNRIAPERGELWKPQDMKKQIEEYDKIIPECEKMIDEVNAIAAQLYRWRNWLLTCGFLALLFGRILEAYPS